MRARLVIATALLGAAAAPALAAGFADLSAIDQAVTQFTGSPIGTAGGARAPVDRRLKLAQCAPGIALEWYGRDRSTVLVRCPEPGGWRLFVPLAVDAGRQQAAAEKIVSRGALVTIVVKGNGFSLTRQGEALDAGAVGDWIRVKPTDLKGAPLRAEVLRNGMVGIELP
jgi:flagellar basal body P-ring formation protein FlgA